MSSLKEGEFEINRKDKSPLVLTCAVTVILFFILSLKGILGLKCDWMSQHTVFPDYFRMLFYENGSLFPNYAFHIGAGQNIYNFSYYGFLSPVILLSYLFPRVSMTEYVIESSIVSAAAATFLLFYWLKRKGFAAVICIGVSCIFLLSTPLLYHSYKQIMFVSYLPFLCLALIGADRYFADKKPLLLFVGTFLMIMSSFFFSIGGILVLVLYGISFHLEQPGSYTWKKLLREGSGFLMPIGSAILTSGILLVPTAASLMNSSRDGGNAVSFLSMITPDFNLLYYIFVPYGFGQTSIAVTVILAGLFSRQKSEKFLSFGITALTVIPYFLYFLNGGLYLNGKVLIPFLPLISYMTALFFKNILEKEQLRRKIALLFFATCLLMLTSYSKTEYWYLFLLDSSIMFLCYIIFSKTRNLLFFFIPITSILFLYHIGLSAVPDQAVEEDQYRKIFNEDIVQAFNRVASSDRSFYRTDTLVDKDMNINRIHHIDQYITSVYSSSFNKDYTDFRNYQFQLEIPYRNDLMQAPSQNPLFLTLMGVKYIRSDYAPVGYELYLREGGVTIYRNEDAYPLGYVTSRLIMEKEFHQTGFPFNQELLLKRAVINTNQLQPDAYESRIKTIDLQLDPMSSEDINISSVDDGYRIHAGRDSSLSLILPGPGETDQVIFIEMGITNLKPFNDMSISIENERNRLSSRTHVYYNKNTVFHFAVTAKKGQGFLKIKLGKGDYLITSLRCFSLKEEDMLSPNPIEAGFIVDKAKTRGDSIVGYVNSRKDGYFITTIPYDDNFKITVDGKNKSYERVNLGFIGFPLEKGRHDIVFHYTSPGFYAGALTSLLGLSLAILFRFCKKLREMYEK